MLRSVKKIGYGFFISVSIYTVVFVLFVLLPGDPARILAGTDAPQEVVEEIRREFMFDRPVLERYFKNLISVLKFDFGRSFLTRRAVLPEVVYSAIETLKYSFTALFISMIYSLLVATLHFFIGSGLLGRIHSFILSFPRIIVSITLSIVFLYANPFRFVGSIYMENFLIASVSLAVHPACALSMILVQEEERLKGSHFIRALKSFGFPPQVIFLYIIRLSLVSWLSYLSNVAASLVAGSIIIESIFSLPGLGRLLLRSVFNHDFPVLQAIVILSLLSFVLIDTVFKVFYKIISPYR